MEPRCEKPGGIGSLWKVKYSVLNVRILGIHTAYTTARHIQREKKK